jgi:hypothetical protein
MPIRRIETAANEPGIAESNSKLDDDICASSAA